MAITVTQLLTLIWRLSSSWSSPCLGQATLMNGEHQDSWNPSGECGKAIVQLDQNLDAVGKVDGFLLYEMHLSLKHHQKRIKAVKPTMPKTVKNITDNSNQRVSLWALPSQSQQHHNRENFQPMEDLNHLLLVDFSCNSCI